VLGRRRIVGRDDVAKCMSRSEGVEGELYVSFEEWEEFRVS
jgi:hypothetical protein